MFSIALLTVKPSTAIVIQLVELLALLGALYLFRKFICQYIVPIVGIVLFVLVLKAMFDHPQQMASSMGGPVMITREFHTQYSQGVAAHRELGTVFFLPGMLSIVLGISNAIPIFPTDGGRIVLAYLTKVNKRASEVFAFSGIALFLLLMIASVGGDLNILVKGLLSLMP